MKKTAEKISRMAAKFVNHVAQESARDRCYIYYHQPKVPKQLVKK